MSDAIIREDRREIQNCLNKSVIIKLDRTSFRKTFQKKLQRAGAKAEAKVAAIGADAELLAQFHALGL